MAFVNLSLVLGTMLVGIPILLHLVMRQKPKQLVFPAVRFIQKRRESNRRTLRLRHWLLLLLRCLVIAAAALALARPSVSSNVFGNWLIIAALALLVLLVGILLLAGVLTRQGKLWLGVLGVLGAASLAGLLAMLVATLRASDAPLLGDRQAPVAAVMLFDSSPRMQYRRDNRTRLEQAQSMADSVVRELPADSQVAVLDSRAIAPVFSLDVAAARKTIERVETTGAPRPLDELITTALQLLDPNPLKRKEIYVYTDLTAAAWETGEGGRLLSALEQAPDVGLYLIDVGVETPQNYALGALQLSAETMPENSRLTVRTSVSATGAGAEGGMVAVELLVEDFDPTLPVLRGGNLVLPTARVQHRQEVTLAADESVAIEFVVTGLTKGTRHAEVRLAGDDALAIDNRRYLAVLVREPWHLLIVAPPDVDTSSVVEAVAPYPLRAENRAAYECLAVTPDELASRTLRDYAAVALLDPPPLSDPVWEQLGSYVRDGGQVAIFLGHEAGDGATFNSTPAQELLPGKLGRQYRVSGRDVYLAPHSYDHPILRPFRASATSVPWADFPVFRYWNLIDLAGNTEVVLRYGNQQPAILERRVGRGTVLTMTTPITELDRPAGRQAWNELAGPNDWPRFVLINEIMRYLAQHDAGHYNYETGQDIVLANHPAQDPSRYLLYSPDGQSQPVQARDDQLMIRTAETPGIYRLRGERDGPVVRGFAANLPAGASRLERATTQALDAILGDERYQLARDEDQLVRVQGQQREGREFYPFLVVLAAAVLVMEQLLANRFYRNTDSGTA